MPADPLDPASLQLALLSDWLTVVADRNGTEHAVLSDGSNRIRLDLLSGHLSQGSAVHLGFRFADLAQAHAGVVSLQRLLALIRHRRFVRGLFPRDPSIRRGLMMLRVHDAMRSGASQREMAAAMFGEVRVQKEWNGTSDSLRSRVRRLVREAGALAGGGYRALLGGHFPLTGRDTDDAPADRREANPSHFAESGMNGFESR